MTIHSKQGGPNSAVLFIAGGLDTVAALQLDRKIKLWGENIINFTLDFSCVDYISSRGLLVLLHTHRLVKSRGGRLAIKNMNNSIREVFKMTRFVNLILHKEKFVVLKKMEANNTVVLAFLGKMGTSNIPAVARELSQIEKNCEMTGKERLLILDMENLMSLSPSACKCLKQVVNKTGWSKRKTVIRNAFGDVRFTLGKEGLNNFISTDDNEKRTVAAIIHEPYQTTIDAFCFAG